MTRLLVVADSSESWLDDFSVIGHVDIVLSLGDLYSYDILKLKPLGVPIFGVYGNHCREGYLDELGATDLSRQGIASVTRIGDVPVLGVSGCVRYSNSATHQWTQDEYRAAIRHLPGADIVVTHCPPDGINDNEDHAHHGIQALREYVDLHHPTHLFHGHTYPDPVITAHGNTQVHYVHGWDVVTI